MGSVCQGFYKIIDTSYPRGPETSCLKNEKSDYCEQAFKDSNLYLPSTRRNYGKLAPLKRPFGGKQQLPAVQINNRGLTTYSSRTSVSTTFLTQRGISTRQHLNRKKEYTMLKTCIRYGPSSIPAKLIIE